MISKMKLKHIFILIGLSILLAACGANGTNDAADNESLEQVSVQLNWVFDTYWVGFYMATDLGYYTENGLDVELRDVFDEDENFIDVIDEVTSGRAQFGVIDTSTLLNARAAGSPVVAIGTIYQRHPLAILSLEENNIVVPQDLIGKTAHISGNSLAMFTALLQANDINPADVNIVERTEFTTAPLTSGDADVIDAWVTFELTTFVVEGTAFNAIYPFDYGIDMYPDLIFTSEEMIENNPEVVQNFLEATLRGIQVTVDNKSQAVEHTLEWAGENVNSEEVDEALSRAIPLFIPVRSSPGLINSEIWDFGQSLLIDMGILEGSVEGAYTLQFLNAIYADGD